MLYPLVVSASTVVEFGSSTVAHTHDTGDVVQEIVTGCLESGLSPGYDRKITCQLEISSDSSDTDGRMPFGTSGASKVRLIQSWIYSA
jgi:hypothetical protein